MSKEYTDRFSDAEKELQEKNAFKCDSCNTSYTKQEAKKKDMSCCGRSLTELLQEGFGP